MTKRLHIAVCSPLLPEFDREAGSKRLFDHVRLAHGEGHQVSYLVEKTLSTDRPGTQRYLRNLRDLGCALYSFEDGDFDELCSKAKVDVFLIAFWHLAELLAPEIRRKSPMSAIIIDSIDLHFVREARRFLLEASASKDQIPTNYGPETLRELATYAASDGVLTVSQAETDILAEYLTDQTLASEMILYEDTAEAATPREARRGVLFVGNFRHLPNVDALEYLCHEILPNIPDNVRRAHPLTVIGNEPTRDVERLVQGTDHATLLGWVPSVEPFFDHAMITVAPLRYGAGTKRKILQALEHCTPTVTTSIAVNGMNIAGKDLCVTSDDPRSFATSMSELLLDERAWNAIALNCARYVLDSNKAEVAAQAFRAAVDRALQKVKERPHTKQVLSRSPKERAIEWATTEFPPWASVCVIDTDATGPCDERVSAGVRYIGADSLAQGFDANYDAIVLLGGRHVDSLVDRLGQHYRYERRSHPGQQISSLSRINFRDQPSYCCNICGHLQTPFIAMERDGGACSSCGVTARWRRIVAEIFRSDGPSSALPRHSLAGFEIPSAVGAYLGGTFDVTQTDFATVSEDHFDIVVLPDMLHRSVNCAGLLGRVYASTRPGGRLFMSEPYSNSAARADLFSHLENAGFVDLQVCDEPLVECGAWWTPWTSLIFTASAPFWGNGANTPDTFGDA